MKIGRITARFALLVSLCLALAAPAEARFWQCVPYARMISGIEIHGNAHTWWGQAKGIYTRSDKPEIGAVMSFKSSGKMKLGHVAMVSKIVSDREVLLTHANWSRPGRVEENVRAVDVSAAGDWSEVQVWFAPTGGLGTSVYPVNGFIYPETAPAIDQTPVENASPFDGEVIAAGGAPRGELLTIVD